MSLAGDTIVPIADAVMFGTVTPGGRALAGTTPDGAQSQQIAYTGVQRGGGGSLVGPGAAPSVAPALALAAGTGLGQRRVWLRGRRRHRGGEVLAESGGQHLGRRDRGAGDRPDARAAARTGSGQGRPRESRVRPDVPDAHRRNDAGAHQCARHGGLRRRDASVRALRRRDKPAAAASPTAWIIGTSTRMSPGCPCAKRTRAPRRRPPRRRPIGCW